MWIFDANTFSPGSFFGTGAFARRPAASADMQVDAALKELAFFAECQLNDIGLCRTHLTPVGLAIAGIRRGLKQVRMDADRAIAPGLGRRAA